MKQKLLMKSLLVAAGLFVGASAWAEATSIYERGTTNAWADADLTDWPCDYASPTIDGGLNVKSKNAGWACTKSISVTENSIVTFTATLHTGGAPGRSGSYDYVKIGGVSARFNEQDKKATVDIDGASSNLSLSYNRSSDYNVTITINQATGAVSYNIGGVEGTSTSTTAVGNVIFGHYRGGSEGYEINPILKKVSVSEEVQAVTMADYTINYIYNSSTIKTVDGTVAIGATVYAENPITVDEVKYFVKDGETTSMLIAAGTNVLNVEMRLPNTYSYSVVGKDGSSNTLATIATGSYTEGSAAIKVYYPRWILSGTTLYSCGSGTIYYSTTFTPNADDYVKTVTYNSGTINDVVFYTEGEDVDGASVGTNDARASKGHMGYTAGTEDYVDATTLAPGKYVIYMRTQNGNSAARSYNFKVGESIVFTGSFANGTNTDANSAEFMVSEASTLSFACEGSSASGIDYFYVVKTGEATVSATIGATGYTTFASTEALDLSKLPAGLTAYYASAVGTEDVTFTSLDVAVPAGTGLLLKGTAGESYSIPVAASASALEGNKLVGCTAETALTANANYWVLVNNGGAAEFQSLKTNGATIPAGKAYLNAAAAGSRLAIVFNDETTGIATVENASVLNENYYNLNGQRIAAPQKGLFIVNGKKVVLK